MKKLLVLLMALMMIVVCSACSNKDDSSRSNSSGSAGNNSSNLGSSRSDSSGSNGITSDPGISHAASVIAGDIVTFGHYEQDNNPGNGPEAIEWMVLDVQDGKVLLLSKYGLDAKPYNTEYEDVTWEKCTLRTWLNNDFLDAVFSTDEQSAILITEVDNSSDQGYSEWNRDSGNNTQDKVFLLSYAEAYRYLGVKYWDDDDFKNIKSRVSPTEQAIKAGAHIEDEKNQTADGNAAGWWWLRSPAYYTYNVAYVNSLGSMLGNTVNDGSGCVRPALWVNLESGIF